MFYSEDVVHCGLCEYSSNNCAIQSVVIFLRIRQPEDQALQTDCLLLRGKGQAKVVKLQPQYHSYPDDIRAPCCHHYIR